MNASDLFTSAGAIEAGTPILLLSDLHFGDGSRTDLFAGKDELLIALLEEQRAEVGAFIFLGDIFDMPQAWRTTRIVSAHQRLVGYIADLARDHRVFFVRGNHDWSVEYDVVFPGALREEAVVIGEDVLAWHGHQVDLLMNPGVRDATAKTYVHAFLERLAGKRLIPPLERHDSRANRAAMALAVAWSRLSLTRASALRRLGQNDRATALEEQVHYLARSVHGDPADIFGATTRGVLGRDYGTIVCGHTHVPGIVRTDRGTYVNTGTWAGDMRTCARWTGDHFVVLDLDGDREIRDEHYVSVPAETAPGDLFEWWERARRSHVGSSRPTP